MPHLEADAVAEEGEARDVERAVVEGSRARELERLTTIIRDLVRGPLRFDARERVLRRVSPSG